MYIVEYELNNKIKKEEVNSETISVRILELYDKIIKITDDNNKLYDKRDILEKEERKLVEILDDTDSKECTKNKIQHYLDENKRLMRD